MTLKQHFCEELHMHFLVTHTALTLYTLLGHLYVLNVDFFFSYNQWRRLPDSAVWDSPSFYCSIRQFCEFIARSGNKMLILIVV